MAPDNSKNPKKCLEGRSFFFGALPVGNGRVLMNSEGEYSGLPTRVSYVSTVRRLASTASFDIGRA